MTTICAPATACGASAGINIIRLSGDDALHILEGVFSPLDKKQLTPRYMTLGRVRDKSGAFIDKALAVYFPAPHSFTGEDVCEIQCHGGPTLAKMILEACLAAGAIMAEPGEFSKRAFLNGKMDMAEAESIQNLIASLSASGVKAAARSMSGELSNRVVDVQGELKDVIAALEAGIEYPDEDIDIAETQLPKLEAVAAKADDLLQKAAGGRILREGLHVAIAGKPNVGKSSILNAILGSDRAIVTRVAGTTRDVIEESYIYDGLPLVFTDTAGIRETEDEVEHLGVERSRRAIEEADIVLFVLDGTTDVTDEEKELFDIVKPTDHIIVLNKSDIMTNENDYCLGEKCLIISAKNGIGITELLDGIKGRALRASHSAEDMLMMTERQTDAIKRASQALREAAADMENGIDLDCITIDLMDAYRAFGEITGETLTEDIIDRIFSKFCLGK